MNSPMNFERLSLPNLPLPDLVALQPARPRRLDPWFERRWVRRLAWVGAAGFLFFAAVWLFFATGLPTSEKLLAYQPPLPTNVRGYDGNPVQTFARERRVELAYDEYPPLVVHAFLSAEDKTFFSHGGIDYPGLDRRGVRLRAQSVDQRRARARRLDHHPAGRQGAAPGQQLLRSAARSARRSSPSASNRR